MVLICWIIIACLGSLWCLDDTGDIPQGLKQQVDYQAYQLRDIMEGK